MRPNSAGADEMMNEFQKIYEQSVVCMNPRVHENIGDGFESAELLRHNTSKSGDVQISLQKNIIHMKESHSEIDYMDETPAPKYLIDEPPKIAAKNDDHKKFCEQIVEYMKTGSHERLVDDFEVAELTRYNTLKPEDDQNGSKEYFDCKKEGQNDSYDITSFTNSSSSTRSPRPMRTPMTVQKPLH